MGLHAHNNLSLAVANTLAAIEAGATMVDSCLQGMGISGGNAQTEILVLVLEKLETVPQINYRTLLYIKTMTLNKHKSEIHDTPGVNTNKILKNCYLRGRHRISVPSS